MKNIDEKEKKLEDTLEKLRDINVQDNKYSLPLNFIFTFAIYLFLPINYLFLDLIHQFFE